MNLRYYPHTLELRHAFTIATASRTTTPAMIVEVEHEGVIGYGEASMPPYLGESQATAAAFLDRIDLTRVADPFHLEEILPAIDALAPGNTAACTSAINAILGKASMAAFSVIPACISSGV
jgi:L-alanine-DL-glutamate epimerase-like enolase superfamily enzyme